MLLHTLGTLAIVALAIYLAKVVRVLVSTRGQPGFITLFPPYSTWPTLFFTSRNHRVHLHRKAIWQKKADLFRDHGSTVLVVASLIPPKVTLIHAINADRKTFSKPASVNLRILSYYGPNILTSDGEEWRRHRRLSATSFSESNVAKAWDEAVRAVGEWHKRLEVAEHGGRSEVKSVEEVMATVTLMVMGEAAFGISFPWPSSSSTNEASLQQSISTVFHEGLLPSLLPLWAVRLPLAGLKRMMEPFDELEAALEKMVKERKAEVESGGGAEREDLLSKLVKANVGVQGKDRLSDQELFSDAYIFTLGGYETSSNTLAATFTLLALYPSHQSRIFDEITSYLASASFSDFTYPEAYNALPYTLATIQEGLRLAGPVGDVLKRAEKDTFLVAHVPAQKGSDEREETRPVFVPKGAGINENLMAAHYESGTWSDAFEFRPSRFLEKGSDLQGFAPFSSGLRGCIGKQFALAEMVVIVSLTLLKYRIEIFESHKEHWALSGGETERERRDRVFQDSWPFSFFPKHVDLAFVRRCEGEKEG
ncbi:hypothetical protein JCM8547_002466 [Rhodosporidiobolus lusitaniae]